jgi:exonuclease III
MSSTPKLNIATLNARGILKVDHNKQQLYAKYLRSIQFSRPDILCIQELSKFHDSHLTTEQIMQLDWIFPNTTKIISKHCGIIIFNPRFKLDNESISIDERIITSDIIDSTNSHIICKIANIYAPAKASARPAFYEQFQQHPLIDKNKEEWLIMGDFNVHLYQNKKFPPYLRQWNDWFQPHFKDIFKHCSNRGTKLYTPLTTFQRGRDRTTIDYVFGHHHLIHQIGNTQHHYLPQEWTDHHMLSFDFHGIDDQMGPGTWRLNPQLFQDESFRFFLQVQLQNFFLDTRQFTSKQQKWDALKTLVKKCGMHFGQINNRKRNATLLSLQKQREDTLNQHILEGQQDTTVKQHLDNLEKSIDNKIKEDVERLVIRTNTQWTEQGENNTKYFYRVLKQRAQQVSITSIRNPHTNICHTTPSALLKEAKQFYQTLYSTKPIDSTAIDQLIASLPTNLISEAQGKEMTEPITHWKLQGLIKETPVLKSPGLDGIGFEFYRFLEKCDKSPAFDLLLDIINDAQEGIFPSSWVETKTVLLFKKGDRQLLSNWRPLSLINCDAKLFTKLITNRIKKPIEAMINPFQTGFIPNRQISDNGWITQALMKHLKHTSPSSQAVAILIDQEKAYDRIHPEYLRKVMAQFGFPVALINTLIKLFFSTKVHISINGWLASPFNQSRGLRQGDPLSPLLFNIAFEPLLRSILSNSLLKGIPIPDTPKWRGTPNLAESTGIMVKLLAYADDLILFANSLAEWNILQDHLYSYGLASNAKVNLSKTIILSLTGKPHQNWISIAKNAGITWHDSFHPDPAIYLGYPLYTSDKQLQSFLNKIKSKIQTHINILKTRALSVKGRAIVVNSLLLSRLWHIARVTVLPKTWISEINAVLRQYLLNMTPHPSYDFCTNPRSEGGLGIIHTEDQCLALHNIYLRRLIDPEFENPVAGILQLLTRLYTYHQSLVPMFMQPKRYITPCKPVPQLHHLVKLLSRLPPVPISVNWTPRITRYIPLNKALLGNNQEATQIIKKINYHVQVQQVKTYMHDTNSYDINVPTFGNSYGTIKQAITNGDIEWNPVIKEQLDGRSNDDEISPPFWFTGNSLDHWTLKIIHKWNKQEDYIPAYKLSSGHLRAYWKTIDQDNRSLPSPHIPYAPPPAVMMSTTQWSRFWKLRIPHSTRTTWWRLLINKLPTRKALRHLNVAEPNADQCQLCKKATEDTYHLILGCPMKASLWLAGQFSIGVEVRPLHTIWAILNFQTPTETRVLEEYGRILQTIWRHHWYCIFENKPWNNNQARNTLFQLLWKADMLD